MDIFGDGQDDDKASVAPPTAFGEALDELKAGLDEVHADGRRRLDDLDHTPVAETTDLTPDIGGALWELVRAMPGVIGNSLSGDEERVDLARRRLAHLNDRLRAAGVELDERFTGYADRLAGLRTEAALRPEPDGDR